jgi:hypothetical protein
MSKLHLLASILHGGAAPVSIPARVLKAAVSAGASAAVEELAKASRELGDGTHAPRMIGHPYQYNARAGGSSAIVSLLLTGFLAGTYGGEPAKEMVAQAFNGLAVLVAPAPKTGPAAMPPALPASGPKP